MNFDTLSETKRQRLDKIVDQAYKSFENKGMKAVTINDIAKSCNLTRRTIYNYFSDKTELILHLKALSERNIIKSSSFVINENKSAINNFERLLKEYCDSYLKDRKDRMFLFQLKSGFLSNKKELSIVYENDTFNDNNIYTIKCILDYGLKEKEFKEVIDTYQYAKLIYYSLTGYLDSLLIGSKVKKSDFIKYTNLIKKFFLDFIKPITINV